MTAKSFGRLIGRSTDQQQAPADRIPALPDEGDAGLRWVAVSARAMLFLRIPSSA